MSRPTVAIAMIVRDAEKTLPALLKSILARPIPIADEFVFVDTGSLDRTCELIAIACGFYSAPWKYGELYKGQATGLPIFDGFTGGEVLSAGMAGSLVTSEPGRGFIRHFQRGQDTYRLVTARFDWIKDFAAARNYAFGLATSDWVGYFDADDEVENGHLLRDAVASAAAEGLEALALPYDYAPGVADWPLRFIARRSGLSWRRRIHETLEPAELRPVNAKSYADIVVRHTRRTEEETARSLARNGAICREAYADAKAAGAVRDAACYAYTLALEALAARDELAAEQLLLETAAGAIGMASRAHALLALSAMELGRKNPERAAEHAAAAVEAEPTFTDCHAAFGIALHRCRNHARAAQAFDFAFNRAPFPPRNAFLVNGFGRGLAALSYIGVGRLDDADKMLAAIPPEMAATPEVAGMIARAQAALAKRRAP